MHGCRSAPQVSEPTGMKYMHRSTRALQANENTPCHPVVSSTLSGCSSDWKSLSTSTFLSENAQLPAKTRSKPRAGLEALASSGIVVLLAPTMKRPAAESTGASVRESKGGHENRLFYSRASRSPSTNNIPYAWCTCRFRARNDLFKAAVMIIFAVVRTIAKVDA
jgi:hypothetical protein